MSSTSKWVRRRELTTIHSEEGLDMKIEGCRALVTGANRGLGKAFAEALLKAGAAKVYAAARDPSTITDSRLIPMQLDVTSSHDVAAAALGCSDIDVLINNSGAMLSTEILDPRAEQAMRQELEVNLFGMLRMSQAFAPVLAINGGGAIVNMLSVVSWYVYPFNATYCASKHAALAATNALRIQLKQQGTQVIGVYAGFIDTDMAATVTGEKTAPSQVADRTLYGIRTRRDHVYADSAAEGLWEMASTDPGKLEVLGQQLWDERRAWIS
jgi:NAD(P)-dependent dehydrogenase (short-subunit alcohol dehydrogenase family)